MRTKILALGLICFLITACESPHGPTTIEKPPDPLSPPVRVADMVFIGELWCDGLMDSQDNLGYVEVQGEVENIGDDCATNIMIHARLYNSENEEIWHGTWGPLAYSGPYGSIIVVVNPHQTYPLPRHLSEGSEHVFWSDIPYEIWSQVENRWVPKGEWVKVTWDEYEYYCPPPSN